MPDTSLPNQRKEPPILSSRPPPAQTATAERATLSLRAQPAGPSSTALATGGGGNHH
ncbi:ATP-dependent RNA helicase [Giardia duodenalis]|uniref:ATP-dependent RNA helicase n=1 Tax=Giardia intestinalis TaxID=5741 RepID=V6TW27_GIAIN|nr:ATP-dependent RNA helicase [Giardia intestinalis]